MKIIATIDEALEYANRLGLSGVPGRRKKYPGWLPFAQENLCRAVDAMLVASGQRIYAAFKPFSVTYSRKTQTFTVSSILKDTGNE